MSDLILAVGFLALPAYAAMEVHRNADRATLAIATQIFFEVFAWVKFDLGLWTLGEPSVTRLALMSGVIMARGIFTAGVAFLIWRRQPVFLGITAILGAWGALSNLLPYVSGVGTSLSQLGAALGSALVCYVCARLLLAVKAERELSASAGNAPPPASGSQEQAPSPTSSSDEGLSDSEPNDESAALGITFGKIIIGFVGLYALIFIFSLLFLRQ